MGTKDRNERERRALDALIASQIRRPLPEVPSEDDLIELSDDDCAALGSLGTDLVQQLLSRSDEPYEEPESPVGRTVRSPSSEPELANSGLNRAEEIDDETRRELELQREEIRRQLREQGESDDDA